MLKEKGYLSSYHEFNDHLADKIDWEKANINVENSRFY